MCRMLIFLTSLHQIDLFREKLPRSPIATYFPDYHGGSDLQAACDYFTSRFVGLNQNTSKQVYVSLSRILESELCTDSFFFG